MGMSISHGRYLTNRLTHQAPPTAMQVLRMAYVLRLKTPAALRPCQAEFEPLPAGASYNDFRDFPPAAVELFAQERAKIREAEEALARRKRVCGCVMEGAWQKEAGKQNEFNSQKSLPLLNS